MSRQKEISIVDYGMGNIGSIRNALDTLGYSSRISQIPEELAGSDLILLPGVGSFPAAMQNLDGRGLIEPLGKEVVENKTPFLGICLGLQLVVEDSTEQGGLTKGLGWIPGHVVKIKSQELPVPHVGWSELEIKDQSSPLFQNTDETSNFYFDHSYHLKCPTEYISATCDYGISVVAAIQKENIFAVQFHPEKSQRSGLKLLRSFIERGLYSGRIR